MATADIETLTNIAQEEPEAFLIGVNAAAKFTLNFLSTGLPVSRDGLVQASKVLAVEELTDQTGVTLKSGKYSKFEAARIGAELSVDRELMCIFGEQV
ncbi:MAG TPA: hypothetical protein VK712_02055 [Verrucomicrobiae bacterium]|jgi:hypothetical protein|nr:hypothetical protein [Verrucomicrobiae bacterium]